MRLPAAGRVASWLMLDLVWEKGQNDGSSRSFRNPAQNGGALVKYRTFSKPVDPQNLAPETLKDLHAQLGTSPIKHQVAKILVEIHEFTEGHVPEQKKKP